jgi:two-component system chemotaxis response regulator CheY
MGYNVLIVDDSVIIRGMVARALDISGVEVAQYFFASNGEIALQHLEQDDIDIVFADINMPVMDGEQMLQKMNERGLMADIPVVVISTERGSKRQQELRKQGVGAYLEKPFLPERLKEIVSELLE